MIVYQSIFNNRAITEIIRIVDTIKIKESYMEEQVGIHHQIVNTAARYIFNSGSSALFLKCIVTVNHYVSRH